MTRNMNENIDASKYELCVGAYGGYYIRKHAPKSDIHNLYYYFAGYDFMGSAVWDEFDIDYDMSKEEAKAIICDLRAAE